MARDREVTRTAQAWIEPVADDPEAMSALAVARARLPAGRALEGLRRLRVFELSGALPDRTALEGLLHRSIQFYNPHKERCAVRMSARDPAPLGDADQAVLVYERDGGRLSGAERWWRHETGQEIVVREGVVWVLGFEPGVSDAASEAAELAVVRDRWHGLLVNPHAQEHRIAAGAAPPVPWMTPAP